MPEPDANGTTEDPAREPQDQDTLRMENLENTMRTIQTQLAALLTQQPTTGTTHSHAPDNANVTADTDNPPTATDNETLNNYAGNSNDNSWTEWNSTWWKSNSWNHNWNWQEERDKPMLSHIEWPTFDGNANKFHTYKYAIQNLLAQVSTKDYKYLVPRLVANVTGSLREDLERIEFNAMDYQVQNGVDMWIQFLQKRINITDQSQEVAAFEEYFYKLKRTRGQTLLKYDHEEQASYRKLQKVLDMAIKNKSDEYSSDEDSISTITNKKFKLPKRLRGWFYMERANIPTKDQSQILLNSKSYNVDKIKAIMTDSYSEKMLSELDKKAFHKSTDFKKKKAFDKFKKKRKDHAKTAEENDT